MNNFKTQEQFKEYFIQETRKIINWKHCNITQIAFNGFGETLVHIYDFSKYRSIRFIWDRFLEDKENYKLVYYKQIILPNNKIEEIRDTSL